MNKTLFASTVSIFLVLVSAVACAGKQPPINAGCPPLPSTFQESDLIGTWKAEYGGGDIDTLILRNDGTFKQIYNDPLSNYSFESEWLHWWIEPRKSGYLRLHMEGMRRCDDTREICDREEGGMGGSTVDDTNVGIDYCEGVNVSMPNEVILVVTGVAANYKNVPKGIWLRQTRIPGSDWTYSFELQK